MELLQDILDNLYSGIMATLVYMLVLLCFVTKMTTGQVIGNGFCFLFGWVFGGVILLLLGKAWKKWL